MTRLPFARAGLQFWSPAAVLVVAALVLVLVPLAAGSAVSSFSVFSLLQTFASYGLVALALGLTIIAGEFDLSTLGMFAFGAMLTVIVGAEQPWLGVLTAVAVGAVSGAVQGTVIARLGINSMAVTLGGYLVLLGLTQTVSDSSTVRLPDIQVSLWLGTRVAEIFSPYSLIVIAVFALVALGFHLTSIGRTVRAVGGDRRTSRVAGVRTDGVLTGVFVASGALSGLAGGLSALALGAALPDPGMSPLVFGATAVLIGGIAITGGQGHLLGIAAGALGLGALDATFAVVAAENWVMDTVTGALLAIAVIASSPGLIRRWRARRQRQEGAKLALDLFARTPGMKP